MAQDKIYESESGRFVGMRKIRKYNDKSFGNMYVILEGRPFDCWYEELTQRWAV